MENLQKKSVVGGGGSRLRIARKTPIQLGTDQGDIGRPQQPFVGAQAAYVAVVAVLQDLAKEIDEFMGRVAARSPEVIAGAAGHGLQSGEDAILRRCQAQLDIGGTTGLAQDLEDLVDGA